jgi:hypothetical protein
MCNDVLTIYEYEWSTYKKSTTIKAKYISL